MIGYILLFLFSIGLFKSFYKTSFIIMIWQLVLMHVNVGVYYRLWDLLSFVAIFLFAKKVFKGEIKINKFPFIISYFVLILSFFLSALFGYTNMMRIGFIGGQLSLFLFPLIIWFAKDKIKNFWNFFLANMIIFTIIIVGIGLIELSYSFNPVSIFLKSKDICTYEEVREDYIRFGLYRCRSLMAWCSTYGVACGMSMITLLMASYLKQFRYNILSLVLCVFLFIAVISTGTRSVYICVCIGMIPLIMNYATKVKYIIILYLIVFVFYINNQVLANDIINSFIHSEDIGGSSTAMRIRQFNSAYNFFIRNPIFGNGIGYVSKAMNIDSNLLGAESCIFIILIDRGLFGIFAYILFNLEMFFFLIRNRKYRLVIFIPLCICIGKIISAFIDINEVYPIFWIAILIKCIDDHMSVNKRNVIKQNCLGLIK